MNPKKKNLFRMSNKFKSFNLKKSNIVQVSHKFRIVCTLPFELCRYGKKVKDCKKFLQELAPAKVSKYHPDVEQPEGGESEEKKV